MSMSYYFNQLHISGVYFWLARQWILKKIWDFCATCRLPPPHNPEGQCIYFFKDTAIICVVGRIFCQPQNIKNARAWNVSYYMILEKATWMNKPISSASSCLIPKCLKPEYCLSSCLCVDANQTLHIRISI